MSDAATTPRPKRVREFILFAILAMLLLVPVRMYVARPFIVSGASMEPTFQENEYLVIDELSYRFAKPQRGDIIIMRYPLDDSKFFIKRIVGMPNETLSLHDGKVVLLGKDGDVNSRLDEPYLAPGVKKEFQAATMAADEYFVLGDNRDESSDSRDWGPLRSKYIVGRVIARIYPLPEAAIFPGKYSY